MSRLAKKKVSVRWLTRDGNTQSSPLVYHGVTDIDYRPGDNRIIIQMENYALWLFTTNITEFQVEDEQ